jgi:hypothetical protein
MAMNTTNDVPLPAGQNPGVEGVGGLVGQGGLRSTVRTTPPHPGGVHLRGQR